MSKKMVDASERSEKSMDGKGLNFLSKEATKKESSIVLEADKDFAISMVLDVPLLAV